MSKPSIIVIAGPTASGKSAAAVQLAKERGGEVISVDSRQVYRGLDIGTEKITAEEMQGVPHHLIDIREPDDAYSAGDFVVDAKRLIAEIRARNKMPILAGGTHFYFDALLHGLPEIPPDAEYRELLESTTTEELVREVAEKDPARSETLDPKNRRRLIRALEIIRAHGHVPMRAPQELPYDVEWHMIDLPKEELRARIDARLASAIERGLIAEVEKTRVACGDPRLNELGLEYRIVGEYIRGERTEDSLLPTLSSKLWHYARRQKAWLRKLADEAGLTYTARQ